MTLDLALIYILYLFLSYSLFNSFVSSYASRFYKHHTMSHIFGFN